MKDIFEQLLVLYIFIATGFLLGKLLKDKVQHTSILSVLLVNVFLPAKVFKSFASNFTVTFITQKYTLLIASIVLLLLLVALAPLIAKWLGKNKTEQNVYKYSVPISNYAYLGYVLIENVFGSSFLTDFIFFAIPFIFYTYTFGYAILTNGGCNLKKLLNPITVAIVLGAMVGITGLNLPAPIQSVISGASSCVGPLSMILTGIVLSTFNLGELFTNVKAYLFLIIKMGVIPAVCLGLCLLLGIKEIGFMVLIITCMPCGLNPIVFSKLVGEDCKPGARLVVLSHIIAMVSLPLWLSLINIL